MFSGREVSLFHFQGDVGLYFESTVYSFSGLIYLKPQEEKFYIKHI